ncbi:MAG: GNAT family protein [Pseudomonadota bacterium]
MNNHIDIKIDTQRLVLKNLKKEHVTNDYVNWLNDLEINKYLCVDTKQTFESCINYVNSFQSKDDSVLIGIFYKKKMLHIGNLTITNLNFKSGTAWIGYSIGRKEFHKKGIAEEALNALVAYCFSFLPLNSINIGAHVKNISSVILAIRCGFRITGIMRESAIIDGKPEDSYILSLLKSEYEMANNY